MNGSLWIRHWFPIALLALASGCISPKCGKVVHLLQDDDRQPFYSFLKEQGRDNDPGHVFTLTNGVLHISGEHYGYFATKSNYSNYKLKAEFRWGEQTWPPRLENARDSGILV